ncbi:unnamed protein product [Urochloa decumbens]|uniref:MATH domain-containing protein n=1 Tax=Urochloa decumbens TaxID=240449 RepID=A0ABC9F8E0_9POAL
MAINSTSAAKHGQCLSETSSRCVTESVTATHNFEVTGFSLLDGMGVGKCVSSSTFSVGGYDWNINVYPEGINKQDDNSAYVSVFLYFRSGAVGARVNFSLSLLDRDGEVSKLRGFVSMFQHTFPAVGGDWGKIKFIKKSDLLYDEEKDTQCVKVHDMEPAIFEALLNFVYTDSLQDDCNVVMQHMLVAADRYGLHRLRLMCEAKLCHSVDVQTVATTLVLAEQHHCTQLKNACLEFIASRNVLGAVMKTDGFNHLITSCPLVMKEILDRVAAVASE